MSRNRFFHETPLEIAECLSREAPTSAKKVLEPSMGSGILIDAIASQLTDLEHLVCVDISAEKTEDFRRKYVDRIENKLSIFNSDFLEWSKKEGKKQFRNYFDCIIMNPPFIAKKDGWVNFVWPYEETVPEKAPLEIAFILQSVPLLNTDGIMLSILPTSAISSKQFKWFREILFSHGIISSVHELPEFSFPNIESKIYLFVFKQNNIQPAIVLKNHSLEEPDTIKIPKNKLNEDLRLDYNFYSSKKWIDNIKTNGKGLQWTKLGNEALIKRGQEKSPGGVSDSVHSTEFSGGFWKPKVSKNYKSSKDSIFIQEDDILIKRVGRNCSSSFGISLGLTNYNCTDCILVVRPDSKEFKNKILFSYRVVYCTSQGKDFLERGTGAKYLSILDLRNCLIPINLYEKFNKEFSLYKEAIKKQNFEEMNKIEHQVFKTLNS